MSDATIAVHNISDRTRPEGGARAIIFGGMKLWPGKTLWLRPEAITGKHRALTGTYLFFGDLPPELRAKRPDAASAAPMTETEFAAYVGPMSLAQMAALGQKVSPPLHERGSVPLMLRALVRAYRSPENLDPSAFYFTRCWTRGGADTFIPRW